MTFFSKFGTVAWGAIFTVAGLFFSLLVWIDNDVGFRDAGSLSGFLAAIFSLIATIWLIVAVVRQGEELGLQREELALQRSETARLGDFSELQAIIQAKQEIRESVQSFIAQRRTSEFHRCYEMLIKAASAEPALGGSPVYKAEFIRSHPTIYANPTSCTYAKWRDLLSRSGLYHRAEVFQSLVGLAREAHKLGLEEWWSSVLVWLVKPSEVTDIARSSTDNLIADKDELRATLIAAMEYVDEKP